MIAGYILGSQAFEKEQHLKIKLSRVITGHYGIQPEKKNYLLHQWTFVPPFEWDGFVERFKRHVAGLAPNRYILQDSKTIEERVKRTVSSRGPYDCFTGPRDDTTIKNHFGPPLFRGTQNWLHTLPSEMDKLKKPEYLRYGKWIKGNRFDTVPTSRIMVSSITLCKKDPLSPSPAEYDPQYPSFKIENAKSIPFTNSTLNTRPVKGFKIEPAPGRYHPEQQRTFINGHTNVFKSHAPRTLSLVRPKMNAF